MTNNNSSDRYNLENSQDMPVDEIIISKKNKRNVKKSEKKDELILSFLSNISCYLDKMND